jgi:hypothetical protein
MTGEFNIKVENKLVKEKRDISVYNHFTRSAHIISDNSNIILPLGTVEQGDYLHISAVRGPGDLRNVCWINLPSWTDFEFSIERKITVTHTYWCGISRLLIKIPPGPPAWQLKVTRPPKTIGTTVDNYVIIGDDELDRPRKVR